MLGSVMTVVENHSGAGGIQYSFTPKWTYWEDLLISCKTTWCRAIKNRAFSVFKVTYNTLKPPKFFWKKILLRLWYQYQSLGSPGNNFLEVTAIFWSCRSFAASHWGQSQNMKFVLIFGRQHSARSADSIRLNIVATISFC